MSHVGSKNKEKVYVVTYQELIFLFFIFISLLLFLYPKDLLKRQIAAETSNYTLSMLYLRNLLIHHPNDESLMLLLSEQSLKSGDRNTALELLKFLEKSKNSKLRDNALVLSYQLYKLNYNDSMDYNYRHDLLPKLKKMFTTIFEKRLDPPEDFEQWYLEAIFHSNYNAVYYYLKKKIKKEPKNIQFIEEAYYLASRLSKKKDKIKYVKQLIEYDTTRYEKWIEAYYYVLMNQRKFKTVELLLRGQALRSKVWQLRLAEFYLMRKSFQKSFQEYEKLFNSSKSYKMKKKYFFKAAGALQAGGLTKKSALFVSKHENYFIRDREVRKFLLKLYIATGNLDYGIRFSNKILKLMGE